MVKATKDTRNHDVRDEKDLAALVGKKVTFMGLGYARYEGLYVGKHVFLGKCPIDADVIQAHIIPIGKIVTTRKGDVDGTGNRDYIEYERKKDPFIYSILDERLRALNIR